MVYRYNPRMADISMADMQEDSRMDLPKQSSGGEAPIRGCGCGLPVLSPGVGTLTGLACAGKLLALRVISETDGRPVAEVAPRGERVCGRRHSIN